MVIKCEQGLMALLLAVGLLLLVQHASGQFLVGAGEPALSSLNEAMAFGHKFARGYISVSYHYQSADEALRAYHNGRADYVLSLSTAPGADSRPSSGADWTMLFNEMVQIPIAANAFAPLLLLAPTLDSRCKIRSLAVTCEALGETILGKHTLSSLLERSKFTTTAGDLDGCDFSSDNNTISFKFMGSDTATVDQKETIARAVARCSPTFASEWEKSNFADLLGDAFVEPSSWQASGTTTTTTTLFIVNAWQLRLLPSSSDVVQLGFLVNSDDGPFGWVPSLDASEALWISDVAVAKALSSDSFGVEDQVTMPGRLRQGGGILSGDPSRGEWPLTCLLFANFGSNYQGRWTYPESDCSLIGDALLLVLWSVKNNQHQEKNVANHGFYPLPNNYRDFAIKKTEEPLCKGQKALVDTCYVSYGNMDVVV